MRSTEQSWQEFDTKLNANIHKRTNKQLIRDYKIYQHTEAIMTTIGLIFLGGGLYFGLGIGWIIAMGIALASSVGFTQQMKETYLKNITIEANRRGLKIE